MRMRFLVVSLAALAANAILCAPAQKAITVSLSPLGGSKTQAEADDDDTVKVQGRGFGATKEAALKDAYRDAIERAVGLYVDAETVAENDQIVKDQILTQSNAYITDYRELGVEETDDGRVQLRILATVKKRALTTKLSGVMPTQTATFNSVGLKNVHAQLTTKKKRAADAAALLKNALAGIDPMKSLMVANIRSETMKIVSAEDEEEESFFGVSKGRRGRGGYADSGSDESADSDDKVTLRYIFEIRLDREKYFKEFVPNLKAVLDQISLAPPKEIRLSEVVLDQYSSTHYAHLREFLNGNTSDQLDYDSDRDGGSGIGRLFTRNSRIPVFFDPLHGYYISWNGDNWVWMLGYDHEYRPKAGGEFSGKRIDLSGENFFDGHYRMDKVYFALITSLNSDCSSGKVTMYELDKSAIPVLEAWRTELVEKDGVMVQKTTNYNIVLLDENGEELGVYPWQIENGLLMNVKFGMIPGAGVVYATPFVGCFGECLIQWRDFKIDQDTLSRIGSVKIELAD